MKYLLPFALLIAAGCAELGVTTLSDETLELTYSAPMSGWTNANAGFDLELRDRCPNGYEKLAERVENVDGQSVFVWQARCL